MTQSIIERIALQMLSCCNDQAMPQHYAVDVSDDLALLNTIPAQNFVWLIREHGTNLLPVGMGVDPIHIEYYLKAVSRRAVFLITTDAVSGEHITPISPKAALELIYQQPALSLASPVEVWDQVRKVLETGIQHGWWSMFYPPKNVHEHEGIKGWLEYFTQSRNPVMQDFLRKARAAA